jgi:H+/Cl- antiporter ClcA
METESQKSGFKRILAAAKSNFVSSFVMNHSRKLRHRSYEIANYFAMDMHTYRDHFLIQTSFLSASVFLGLGAVYFNKLITVLQRYYHVLFERDPYVMTAITPLAFWAATAVAKYFAPQAGGSGVPQVLYAASIPNETNTGVVSSGLLSIRTAIVKIFSTAIGFIGGASIGGEGPTVQISGAIFATVGTYVRKFFPKIDFRSYIVAAGGAGIAAAFNTPLGGVTFALEEVALSSFGRLRHAVMLAVIVAGLTAQALVGDELYFGKFAIERSDIHLMPWAIVIGLICGLLGGLFGRIVSSRRLYNLRINWWQRTLICGVLVALIDLGLQGSTAGSGYRITKAFMNGTIENQPFYFPLAKILATALSTLSGMGGGILAPSITIGAWSGVAIAKLASIASPKACALLGMAAYFSSAFQIPVTAVIVVMEMTNQHDFIIPMMVASVCAYLVGRIVMPTSLYHILIDRSFHKTTLSD